MIEKIKASLRFMRDCLETCWHFLKEAVKNMFRQPYEYIRDSGWKKIVFFDIPVFAALTAAAFLFGGGWMLAYELLTIALIAFYFGSLIIFKEPSLKNVVGLVVGIIGVSIGIGMWYWVRELAIIFAAFQFPRLTLEAKQAFLEGYNHVKKQEAMEEHVLSSS